MPRYQRTGSPEASHNPLIKTCRSRNGHIENLEDPPSPRPRDPGLEPRPASWGGLEAICSELPSLTPHENGFMLTFEVIVGMATWALGSSQAVGQRLVSPWGSQNPALPCLARWTHLPWVSLVFRYVSGVSGASSSLGTMLAPWVMTCMPTGHGHAKQLPRGY